MFMRLLVLPAMHSRRLGRLRDTTAIALEANNGKIWAGVHGTGRERERGLVAAVACYYRHKMPLCGMQLRESAELPPSERYDSACILCRFSTLILKTLLMYHAEELSY